MIRRRKSLRDTVQVILSGVVQLQGVTFRRVMAKRPDIDQLPDWTIETSGEQSRPGSVDDLERVIDLEVHVRRVGDDAPDDLDADVEAIESAVIEQVERLDWVQTCEMRSIRFAFDSDGSRALGQATIQFEVLHFAPRLGGTT